MPEPKYYPLIMQKLSFEVWLWEKEQSHRLFNFQDGYRVDENNYQLIGSSKLLLIIFNLNLDIITKKTDGNIEVVRASNYEK